VGVAQGSVEGDVGAQGVLGGACGGNVICTSSNLNPTSHWQHRSAHCDCHTGCLEVLQDLDLMKLTHLLQQPALQRPQRHDAAQTLAVSPLCQGEVPEPEHTKYIRFQMVQVT
jgi:hypothetical protein